MIRQSTITTACSATMHSNYSFDTTINGFIESQSIVARRQCNELAVSLVGEPVNPAPIQGAFSCTVIAGVKQSKIVQSRAQSQSWIWGPGTLARAIHGQFVAARTLYLSRKYRPIVTTFCIRARKTSRNNIYLSTVYKRSLR